MDKTQIIVIAIVWMFTGIITSIACYKEGKKKGRAEALKEILEDSMRTHKPPKLNLH